MINDGGTMVNKGEDSFANNLPLVSQTRWPVTLQISQRCQGWRTDRWCWQVVSEVSGITGFSLCGMTMLVTMKQCWYDHAGFECWQVVSGSFSWCSMLVALLGKTCRKTCLMMVFHDPVNASYQHHQWPRFVALTPQGQDRQLLLDIAAVEHGTPQLLTDGVTWRERLATVNDDDWMMIGW